MFYFEIIYMITRIINVLIDRKKEILFFLSMCNAHCA